MDYSDPDLLHILKEVEDEARNQSPHSLFDDTDVRDFVILLCQSIDSRNILTPEELLEYEVMQEAGEVLHDEELEAAYSKFFPGGFQENEVEDNHYIIEEIESADSHIDLVTQLQKTLSDEIRHVSSGIHRLEQQEKGAHYDLVTEVQNCIKLDSKIYSTQEELFNQLQCFAKLSADYQDVKCAPQLIGQMPLEMFKKRYCQFDYYMKILMRQYFEWKNTYMGDLEEDMLEELEQSVSDMKVENMCMLAIDQGIKGTVMKMKELISEIQGTKFSVSLNDMRNQCPLLDEKVSGCKNQVSLIENEMKSTIEDIVKMDILQLKMDKNEYKLCKQRSIFKQYETLSKCLDVGLRKNELLTLLLVIERQKLVDMSDLLQLCYQELKEEHSQFMLRMKMMQELKEESSCTSRIDNPLFQCVMQLHHDKHSVHVPVDFHNLMLEAKKFNQDIMTQEEELFDSLCNKQKNALLKNENAIKSAEKYLCAGLSKKPLLLRLEISTPCNNIEQLLESFQEMLNKMKDNYEKKQKYFSEKPLHAKQRLLWIYFLTDPKKLVAAVTHLQEMAERKIKHNMLKSQKNRRETTFVPRRL